MTDLKPASELAKPSLIIHLGAGRGEELDEYLAQKAERIVLVEANPETARFIAGKISDYPNVEVIPSAISIKSGKAVLKVFNMRALSSLRTPTAIVELFPGLQLRKEVEVSTISPDELIENVGLSADKINWLVIDIPGEESTVIETLHKYEKLQLFDRIVLHCPKLGLYEGSRDADALLQVLADNGFDVISCDDKLDPDRPCWVLQKNPIKIENRKLLSRINELTQEKDELANQRQSQIEQLVSEKDQFANTVEELRSRTASLDNELEQTKKSLEDLNKASADTKSLLEQTIREKEEVTELANQRQSQIEQLTSEKDQFARLLEERQSRIEQLETSQAELESRQGLLAEEMARAEGQIDLIKDILFQEPRI